MRGNISSLTGFLQLPDGRQPDLHGEVGDESGGGQVHLKGRLLDDGELVPHRALDGGDGIAGHHRAPHVVLRHLQLRQKHASPHQRKDHKWGFSPDGSEQNSRTELQAAPCVGQNPLLTGTQEKLVNNHTHHSPPFFSFMSPFSLHGNDTQQLPAWSGGDAGACIHQSGQCWPHFCRMRESQEQPQLAAVCAEQTGLLCVPGEWLHCEPWGERREKPQCTHDSREDSEEGFCYLFALSDSIII